MGNDELSAEERTTWRDFDRIAALPPEQMLPAFVANQLATGVEPPPPPPGPQPPWMASRPAGLRTIIETFRASQPRPRPAARVRQARPLRARRQEQPRLLRPDGGTRDHDLPRHDARGLRGAPPLRPSAPDRARAHGDGAASALGARERLSVAVRMGSWPRRRAQDRVPLRSTRAGSSSRAAAGLRRSHASNAPSASKETPEAHEGLSWAAWWLDDADVVFAARDRAYRLYKQRGDRPAAARMATWLACDELDFHGAFAVASGWLGRARRLLGELEPGAGARLAGVLRGLHRERRGRQRPGDRARRRGGGDRPPPRGTRPARCSASRSRAPRWWRARTSTRACAASTRRPRRRSRERQRSRSRARGPAAFWSRRARRCGTTSARRSGVTASRSSPSATEAGTCSRSAAPSTARCTSGAGAGARRRRCSRRRSRTSPDRDPRWSAVRWRPWPSCGGARDVPRTR